MTAEIINLADFRRQNEVREDENTRDDAGKPEFIQGFEEGFSFKFINPETGEEVSIDDRPELTLVDTDRD